MTNKPSRPIPFVEPDSEPVDGPSLLAIEKQRHIAPLVEAARNGDLAAVSKARRALVGEGFMTLGMFWAFVDKVIDNNEEEK